MAVTINFSSVGNPPNNITNFRVERSVRPASGTIALLANVNNVTKVVGVIFSGTPPSDGELAGDQMYINDLLYTIVTNTSSSITFTSGTDLSTISSFPASFLILNDLAQFSTFELVGIVTPDIPFSANTVHQFTDSTGNIFDFYQVKSVDSGGNIGSEALSTPFRPGQVVNLAIDEPRKDPKDDLTGVIGGSITFEVEVLIGGRRQDPKDNSVIADIFMPSYLSPDGKFTRVDQLTFVRVGLGRYRATWTVPDKTNNSFGSFTIYPSDEYVISYRANFFTMLGSAPNSYIEFDSELFVIKALDGPVFGRFPAYATLEDLRQTLFEIDAYLPEAINKTNLDARNKVLQYHLDRASDKLREELNYHQLRSNSLDRREYVAARAVYTILMAARGQNSSAISDDFLKQWDERCKYIIAQLKREGAFQGVPLGRG